MRIKIYVAGPYTQGDVEENVRRAITAANDLADLGFAPYVPHFTHFWEMQHPRPYEFWLELDNEFLPVCHGLLRLPGPSNGADKEVAFAQELNLPIFYSLDEIKSFSWPTTI